MRKKAVGCLACGQFEKFILLLLAILMMGCSNMQYQRKSKPKDLKGWFKMADSLLPTVLHGEWPNAEGAWHDIKIAMPTSENTAIQYWIDMQVKIIDETSMNPKKLLLRKVALQELEFYPAISIKYYDWALQKKKDNSFSDTDMQAHLDLILSRFEKIRGDQ